LLGARRCYNAAVAENFAQTAALMEHSPMMRLATFAIVAVALACCSAANADDAPRMFQLKNGRLLKVVAAAPEAKSDDAAQPRVTRQPVRRGSAKAERAALNRSPLARMLNVSTANVEAELGEPTLQLLSAPALELPPLPVEESPASNTQPAATPAPSPAIQPVPETISLYPHVCYEDPKNVHPCSTKAIVAVKDPNCCSDPCNCCQQGCVYVEICVPPCGDCEFDCKRKDGSKVEYDYGNYEIEITSRDGVVYVDYDD
jgi:hypothetical protein